MLVLDDEGFAENGVERNNLARTDLEHDAQANGSGQGTSAPITSGSSSPSSTSSDGYSSDDTNYGGALDPLAVGLSLVWLLGGMRRRGAAK
jgi:hypothetical protein